MPDRAQFRAAHRRGLSAVALVLAVAVAGCGGDDDAADLERDGTTTTRRVTTSTAESPATPTPAPSSTVADPLHQEIIDRYIGYWDARFGANTGTPNPSDAALAEYASGEQLEAVMAETQHNLDEGVAFRPAVTPHNYRRVRVVSVDGDLAVVQECYVADGVIYRRDSGAIVNDEVATHNVRGELRLVDGKWRVAHTRLVQRWEGVDGCALAS